MFYTYSFKHLGKIYSVTTRKTDNVASFENKSGSKQKLYGLCSFLFHTQDSIAYKQELVEKPTCAKVLNTVVFVMVAPVKQAVDALW